MAIKFQLQLIKRDHLKNDTDDWNPLDITENKSYKDKNCDQLATNHFKHKLLSKIKRYIFFQQQYNEIQNMDEYIKAIEEKIAPLKNEVMFLSGEVTEKTHSLTTKW